MHPVFPLPSPWPNMRSKIHSWQQPVVWNQDGSLGGIVANAVDRIYLRVSVHDRDGSDRLRLIDTAARGEDRKGRKEEYEGTSGDNRRM